MQRSEQLKWILGLSIAAICSWVSWQYPIVAPYFFGVFTLGYIVLLWLDFEAAVLVAFLELFVGSFGRWLSVGPLSARYAIFALLIAASLVRLCKRWQENSREIKVVSTKVVPIFVLAIIVALSVAHGLLRGYGAGQVLADANAYGYLALLLPVWLVTREGGQVKERVIALLKLSALALAVFTLALLFIFTHDTGGLISNMYHWVRDTRLGEITWTTTGAYRIFLQSQLFILFGFWLQIWKVIYQGSCHTPTPTHARPAGTARVYGVPGGVSPLVALAITGAAILISFSRSYWLGLILAALAGGAWLLYDREWGSLKKVIGYGVTASVGAFVLILVVLNFPIPKPSSQGLLSLGERLDLTEAAASSRWQLLPPLWSEIKDNAIIGAGFGKTVTYISNDPRIRAASPSGEYATFAFEWGYLDQWLKFGAVGLVAYAWIIILIIRGLWRAKYMGDQYAWPLLVAFVTLLGLHIGTPYFNHPLGIVFVVLLYAWYVAGSGSRNVDF